MKTIIKILAISTLAYCQINTLSYAQRGNSLEFIENKGQIVDMEGNLKPDILYVGDGGGVKIYLRQGGVSYVMTEVEGLEEIEELEEAIEHEKNEIEKKKKQEKLAVLEANAKLKGHRVDMEFVNGNVDASVRIEEPTQGYFNYYLGHCPQGITGVKAHRKVIYENMYPNIDVVFYGGIKDGMEYDFVVKSGGNVEDIRLRYVGADQLSVINDQLSMKESLPARSYTQAGKLRIKTSLGEIKEEIPEVYQIINGERVEREAAYVLEGNEVSIKVGNYDKSNSLIIDPWITYYGGSDKLEHGFAIATDGSGNAMITGNTTSSNFPVTPGAFQTSHAGGVGSDAFVVKFGAAGNRLWATYYGGNDTEWAENIATDSNGNVLITGWTVSTDFPVTAGAFQTSNAGGLGGDAFVVKLDAAGNRLWATYYGGSGSDIGKSIATDGSDNVVITGQTFAADFPVTTGAFQTTYGGSLNDAFVVKFDAAGNRLWATFYGGFNTENGWGIATDGSGNVLITGGTGSPDFPVTAGAFQTNPTVGGGDGFVVKLDAAGNRLWATFYRGGGGTDIAIDGNDNVVITGGTTSTDFPVTAGAFQTSYAGGGLTPIWADGDATVVKFDAAGNRLWAMLQAIGSGLSRHHANLLHTPSEMPLE